MTKLGGVRMLQDGENSQADGLGGELRTKKQKSEKKKVMILVVLAVLACAVFGWRFLQGKGPEAASGALSNSPFVDEAASLLAELDVPASEVGVDAPGSLNVDEIVRRFYEYSEKRQVPLADLPVDPFADFVAQLSPPKPVEEETAEVFEEPPPEIVLGGILVGPNGRTAILDGQLYHEGEMIKEYLVQRIDLETVLLVRGKDTMTLTTKEGDQNKQTAEESQ